MTTRKGWRPGGRWEPIAGGIGADRAVVYWNKQISPTLRLTVTGRTWKVHRRDDDHRFSQWWVAASGEAGSLADAKRAAEAQAKELTP